MPSMASNKNLDKKEPEVINNQSNEFVPSGRVRNNVHNPYGVAKEDKKDIFQMANQSEKNLYSAPKRNEYAPPKNNEVSNPYAPKENQFKIPKKEEPISNPYAQKQEPKNPYAQKEEIKNPYAPT